jgi:hypothetical protein
MDERTDLTWHQKGRPYLKIGLETHFKKLEKSQNKLQKEFVVW